MASTGRILSVHRDFLYSHIMVSVLHLADQSPITASCHVSLVAPPGRGWRFAAHAHDFVEALCVRSGIGLHAGPGGLVELRPGDIALVPLGTWHEIAPGADDTELVNVAVPAPIWTTLVTFAGLRVPAGPDALVSRAADDTDRDGRVRWFSDVLAVSRTARPGPGIVGFLVELAAVLAAPSNRPPTTGWFDDTLEAVHSDDVVLGGLPALLGAAGVSYGHLARTCRDRLGCTPTELVNRARVDRAKGLLATTSLPVTAVAQRVGFATLSRFYSVFRAECGTAPGAFRAARYAGLHPNGSARR